MRNVSMKKILFMFVVAAMFSCNSKSQEATSAGTDEQPKDSDSKVTLLFIGDMMQHDGQIKAARQADGTYAYHCFDKVKPIIESADVAIANLEVTHAGPPHKGYPRFCAPDEYLYAIHNAGVDVLLTANNHCCDTGKKGLERTIDLLDSLKIPHLGTYKNAAERDRTYPLMVEKNGIKIALLNYTYGTNGIPTPQGNIVNLDNDREQIKKDIAKAKSMNPDVIIANMHWGIEYVLLPNSQQKEFAQWLLDQGVDHVIGGHPHVIQPAEVRQNAKTGEKNLVVYSLGNYVSNMTKPNCTGGLMVKLELEKKNGKVGYAGSSYGFVWVSRPAHNGKDFMIWPADNNEGMNNAEKAASATFFSNMRAHMQKNCVGIGEWK